MAMQKSELPYIADGLILWLDGIKKGSTSGTWTDAAFEHQFVATENVSFGGDYIQLNGNTNCYLSNTSFIPPSSGNGTIEVVLSDFVMGTALVYMPNESRIAFGTYLTKGIIWAADGTRPVVLANNFRVASITSESAIVDGQSAQFDASDARYWGGATSTNLIGKRSSGNPFSGKIHCIRIYDRHLSTDEMLYNQRVDNERFNLGLSV